MTIVTWVIFSVAILIALLLDLGLHSNQKKPSLKSAFFWSLFWTFLALLFNGWIYFAVGEEPALNFLAAYLVERALSIDNLFVFVVIFNAFQIPAHLRHKVLFWGVIGAFVMRALFIAGGIALVNHFNFILYFFGAFLIYTGFKLAFHDEEEIHPENNPVILWFQKWMPVDCSPSTKFFTKKNQTLHATPLFLALIAVEISDLIFAVDSIPAVIGITQDPLIVFTSNIFAILGLRSLYFVLEKTLDLFHYLNYGLAFILTFIGIKMLINDLWHISVGTSLLVITLSLALSIGASLIFEKKN